MNPLSHIDDRGKPQMVDVSQKSKTVRTAVARGRLQVQTSHLEALKGLEKGDPIATAQLAGIIAAKKTPDLIPLCHSINLQHVSVEIEQKDDYFEITSKTTTNAETGVEMEAYVAVAMAGLTLIDMLKGAGPDLTLGEIQLLEKNGGKQDWKRA